jgi:hypothetical protein
MLFVTTYTPRATVISEATEKRVLQLFAQWKPAAGQEIKGWWLTPGGLGVQISEAKSAEAIMESIAPWGAYFEFNVQPAVEIGQAVAHLSKAIAWRDSIK